MHIKLIVFLAAMIVSPLAWGQCPYGMPNTPGCVPPSAWPQNNGGAQPSSKTSPRWKKTWGAMALDNSSAEIKAGAVAGADSKRIAEKEAVSKCKENGGGSECKVFISYYNQCMAFVSGDWRHNASSAATIELAAKNAMAVCEKVTVNCEVIYTECTAPYQR